MSGDVDTLGVAQAVAREALEWVGTPYRHQGRCKGVACDCLGLVLGIWRQVYGFELPAPGPYAPDWAEASGQERLLDGFSRHLVEKPISEMETGDAIVFRWRRHLPAKHAAILVGNECFIHAYQGHGVTMTQLVPQWQRRIAAAFAFPDINAIR